MRDSTDARPLTGWQRAHVLSAAQYVRERALKDPGDDEARAAYERLLEVLEPTRRAAREHREQRRGSAGGSMWEQRSGRDRRAGDRRSVTALPPDGRERRVAQRRSGRDRRGMRA